MLLSLIRIIVLIIDLDCLTILAKSYQEIIQHYYPSFIQQGQQFTVQDGQQQSQQVIEIEDENGQKNSSGSNAQLNIVQQEDDNEINKLSSSQMNVTKNRERSLLSPCTIAKKMHNKNLLTIIKTDMNKRCKNKVILYQMILNLSPQYLNHLIVTHPIIIITHLDQLLHKKILILINDINSSTISTYKHSTFKIQNSHQARIKGGQLDKIFFKHNIEQIVNN